MELSTRNWPGQPPHPCVVETFLKSLAGGDYDLLPYCCGCEQAYKNYHDEREEKQLNARVTDLSDP
jgi:hypothetical protein